MGRHRTRRERDQPIDARRRGGHPQRGIERRLARKPGPPSVWTLNSEGMGAPSIRPLSQGSVEHGLDFPEKQSSGEETWNAPTLPGEKGLSSLFLPFIIELSPSCLLKQSKSIVLFRERWAESMGGMCRPLGSITGWASIADPRTSKQRSHTQGEI